MIGFLWPFDASGGDDVTGVTPLFRYSNYVEAVLWMSIGAFVLARARRRGKIEKLHWVLAVTFLVFGVSDFVEANTGAWWRPPWLLVWKGGCLILFLAVFLVSRKDRGLGASPKS